MTSLGMLWLPILLSTVATFLVSSLIHMVLPWHKNDYPLLKNQEQVLDALRPFDIPPGDYFLPRPSNRNEMRSPEFIEKMKKGPVMMLTVLPNGLTPMGRNLGLWFAYCAVVGLLAAYVAGRALPVGAEYLRVFRFVGTTAFIGYSVALWQMSIWYRRAWSLTVKATVDGLIYAVVTAALFAWLWP